MSNKNKHIFVFKKLGKIFNRMTSIDERVVIKSSPISRSIQSKFTAVFYKSNPVMKEAMITEVDSDLEEELEILTSINRCIAYLLSIGYAVVYLSTRYIKVCTVSDLYHEVRHDCILFSKKN